jgi:hypothetical protein
LDSDRTDKNFAEGDSDGRIGSSDTPQRASSHL